MVFTTKLQIIQASGDKYIVPLADNCEVTQKEYFHVRVTGSVGPHELEKNSIIKHN